MSIEETLFIINIGEEASFYWMSLRGNLLIFYFGAKLFGPYF